MEDIREAHEYCLEELLKRDIIFRPRKTNRGNRLKDGYWFLGNNYYLSIGFWEGMNWKTKVPNISFVIDIQGNSKVQISISDSPKKQELIENYFTPFIYFDFIQTNNKLDYYKTYSKNYKESFIDFLDNDYHVLNEVLKSITSNIQNIGVENPFVKLNPIDFQKDVKKINKYRDERLKQENLLDNIEPNKLLSFEIENYGSIKRCRLEKIPVNTKWIFLTGENGVGKTQLLKALSTAIGVRKLELDENKKFRVRFSLSGKNNEELNFDRIGNFDTNKRKPYSIGFAAYGAMRLKTIYGGLSSKQLKDANSKSGRYNSLFKEDSYLLDLQSAFEVWRKDKKFDSSKVEDDIREMLLSILPSINDIVFNYTFNEIPITLFTEIDANKERLTPIGIDKLSTGYLSIISMISDMLIRLYNFQKDVVSLSDLKGIVFIDEIDIHLHPKFQKYLVEQLAEIFPNVQFIVTTHSPIPMLGAPKETVFIKVTRSKENGVELTRLDEKIYIEDLLPNSILTSPIFGLEDITHNANENGKAVRTENNFDDISFNNEVEKKLNEYLTSQKEDKLIKLFEDRRKKK